MNSWAKVIRETKRRYRICSRCIMDTSDNEIVFDANGHCNHCTRALNRIATEIPSESDREGALAKLVETMQYEGAGRQYDCIIGVSGGVDSTTTAVHTKRRGLRPLAVHFDNGWDSELAGNNIRRMLDALGMDLYTHVVNWEEFRDLQLSFLAASVANCEIPTDHGITALLFAMAWRHKVRFILSGSNLATESIMPHSWGHYNQDLRHIEGVHSRFGHIPLETMPTISVGRYLRAVLVKSIRQIPFLNYFEYNKSAAKALLARELGWRDYGGKHYESVWTRFFQGYYLPTKFGIDKRRAHSSSLICAGQISRGEALEEIERPAYDPELLRQDKEFVRKKFGLSEREFCNLLEATPKRSRDYPSHYFLFHRLRLFKERFRKIAISPT